jgi:hypothetical protein
MTEQKAKNRLTPEQMVQVESSARAYMSSHGSISNREIRSLSGINYDQAIWFFNQMTTQGKFDRVGVASKTRYVLRPGGSES